MTKHSIVGASKARRWLNCPGSVALCKDAPEQETSFYAAEGQAAHSLAEKVMNDTKAGVSVDKMYSKYHGDNIESEDGREFRINDEMWEAVMVYRDAILEDVNKYEADFKDLDIEKSFTLDKLWDEAYGTSDAVLFVAMDRLIVYDFKYGKGNMVDAEDNEQLLFYALGAFGTYEEIDAYDLTHVELVIVQPRGYSDAVKRAVYPITKLKEFRDRCANAFYVIKNEKNKLGNTLKAGDWCKYCTAKPTCPEFRRVPARAADVFKGLADMENNVIQPPAPNTLTPEQIAKVLANASVFSLWVSSVREYAESIAKQGTSVPGYKLIQKKGNLSWIDETKAVKAYKSEFGDEMFKKSLITPTQFKKLLGKKRLDELADYTERPDKDLSLVPESASGEAVKIANRTLFADFEDM